MFENELHKPVLDGLSRRGRRRAFKEWQRKREAVNTVTMALNLTSNTGRNQSGAIWSDCPEAEIIDDPSKGMFFFDDFTGPVGTVLQPTTEAGLSGLPYSGFGSAAATITYGTGVGGELVQTIATDNLATYVRSKGAFQISSNKGRLWFEARVKISTVADDNIGFIMGLWDDVATSVIVPLSTANPPIMATTGNFVGFHAPEEDAGVVQSMYDADDAGQTTDAQVAVQESIHTFVADTYVKLGMKFLPRGFGGALGGSARLTFWVNGVMQSGSKVIPNATGTDFPADVLMGPLIGHRMGATASGGVTTLDWWKCVQEF